MMSGGEEFVRKKLSGWELKIGLPLFPKLSGRGLKNERCQANPEDLPAAGRGGIYHWIMGLKLIFMP